MRTVYKQINMWQLNIEQKLIIFTRVEYLLRLALNGTWFLLELEVHRPMHCFVPMMREVGSLAPDPGTCADMLPTLYTPETGVHTNCTVACTVRIMDLEWMTLKLCGGGCMCGEFTQIWGWAHP